MTTPKAFKDLEAFSDYPSGYEPVVETQKQLIVQSMKKSKHQRQIAVIFTIAASVVILVFGDRFSVIGDRGAVTSGQRSAVSGQRSAVSGQQSAVSGQRSAISGQRSMIVERKSVIGDRFSVIGDEGAVFSSQPKTKDQGPKTNSQPSADSRQPIADSRQLTADSGQPSTEIFLTRQRYKQFEFNRPPEAVKRPQEEKKKTEFFVFQNGNFKIINRPNQSQNTVIYTK